MLFAPKLAAAVSASALLLLTATPAAPAQQGSLPEAWIDHLDWRNVGPANMGGRCTSIAVNPHDSAEYWVGTATGGVLYTSNRGVTYEHQFESESTSSVGSIAVAKSNTDVVWVGSGESNPRNSVSWGHGVFKSTDGGKTWKNMGLRDTFQIGVVKIHPEDENIVYVGALGRLWGDCENRGLYKTTDGGENWEKVLFVDDKTGIIDMRLDPQNPDTMIVATYERQRDGFDTNDPAKKWGSGSGIHKSTDGGKTWTELRNGLPSGTLGRIGLDYSASEPGVIWAVVESDRITQEPENAAWMGVRGENAEVGARVTSVEKDGPAEEAGLKVGDIVILMAGQTVHSWSDMQGEIRSHLAGETIGVVVSRDRERVEMDVTFRRKPSEDEDRESEEEGEGETEEEEDDSPPPPGPFHLGLGGQVANVQDQQGEDGHEYGGIYRSADNGETWTRINSLNPRPMYYSRIYVDPSDGEKVYVLGTRLHKSMDGGKTFTPDGHGGEVHVDHHAMWINPEDGRNMILGNDGGIYVTFDRMGEWDHHNHMALGQFYQVEADATRDYKVYGGLQDNGSWGGPNRVANNSGPVNSDWFNVGGGDGFVVRVDPNDPNQIYGESQNGWTYRVNLESGAQSSIRARPPRGERYRFNWNTPFILSPHNSQVYYSAGNHVFRSPDKGNGLTAISPEITLTDRGSATALHESPAREGVIYVGTDDGALWMTPDHGKTWIDLYNPPAEEAEGEAETSEVAASEASEEAAATPATPLDGKWSGQAEHEEIPEGQGAFTMNLKVDEQGRISGSMSTDFGDSTLSDGKFDADENSLRFRFASDMMSGIVTGKIDGNTMTGEIDAGPGMIVLDFEAKREGAKAADPTASETPQARAGGQGEGRGGAARGAARGGGQGRGGQARGQFQGRDLSELPPEVQERIRARQAEGGGGRGGRARQEAAPSGNGPQGLAAHMGENRFHVSSIAASEHSAERVYITLDGHRSNDDLPHVFRSDDMGRTWTSLRGNLPDGAGSARVIVEDYENPDVLFLGTEFGAWASIDRGASWTRINNDDLPTVPVHDFKLHRLTGELIAGTHGRSIWIVDVSTLRQLSAEAMAERVMLYQPEEAMIWKRARSAGSSGTRRFVGENPTTGAALRYSLGSRARSVQLWITDIRGETIWEADDAPTTQGLHEFRWNLRGAASGGRRWSPPVPAGEYLVNLKVDGNTQTKILEVIAED